MVVWIQTVIDNEPSPYYVDETNTVEFLVTGVQFWGIYEQHYFSYEDVCFITSTLDKGYALIDNRKELSTTWQEKRKEKLTP